MALRELFRVSIVVVLCVLLAVPAFPQSGGYGPNISNGEIAGVIAGIAAVLGVGGYLIYRAAHKHSSLQGCVISDQNGLHLKNDKDKKTYLLMGNAAGLASGQHVGLTGKKVKDSSGKPAFQVQKLNKDLGACSPVA